MISLYIGIAGMIGAITRYGISAAWNPQDPSVFPWGTLICNLAGCLLLSFIANASFLRIGERLRLAVTTGFIGSFTTFSTFSYEAFIMLRNGYVIAVLIYVSISFGGGLLFAWFGYLMAQAKLKTVWPKFHRRPRR